MRDSRLHAKLQNKYLRTSEKVIASLTKTSWKFWTKAKRCKTSWWKKHYTSKVTVKTLEEWQSVTCHRRQQNCWLIRTQWKSQLGNEILSMLKLQCILPVGLINIDHLTRYSRLTVTMICYLTTNSYRKKVLASLSSRIEQ